MAVSEGWPKASLLAPRFEELCEPGQARTLQHWSPEGKRSGERKRPTFHPPRSRTICVQQDKHWHCFDSNLGETAERQGRARMGLSERYKAILSWKWNWNLLATDVACPINQYSYCETMSVFIQIAHNSHKRLCSVMLQVTTASLFTCLFLHSHDE